MKKKSEAKISTKINIDMEKTTMGEIKKLIREKLLRIQEIIKSTILSINQYRKYELCSNSDVLLSISSLQESNEKAANLLSFIHSENSENPFTYATTIDQLNPVINILQSIIDKLSVIISGFGTKNIQDIFFISFGSDNINTSQSTIFKDKIHVINSYFHPVGYKTYHWKQLKSKPKETIDETYITSLCLNKMSEECLQMELSPQFECFDIDISSTKSMHLKIHGCRVVVHNEKTQKTLVIQGILDDIILDCLQDNRYVDYRKQMIHAGIPNSDTFDKEIMQRIIETMSLKDILVFGNSDIYKRHITILTEVNYIKYNKLCASIKKFLDLDLFYRRQMLIHLLIYNKEEDIQYITYLLYDLIGSKEGNNTDSSEQLFLYDSFPWRIKIYFKDTMKNTMQYTTNMINKYDINRVSLEQQIYVMKVPENVREKAMVKLKEIKSKSDDTGSKAKQYLEGLLKIPFGIYREEPILKKLKKINKSFCELSGKYDISAFNIETKEKRSNLEIIRSCTTILNNCLSHIHASLSKKIGSVSLKTQSTIYNTIYDSSQLSAHKKSKEDKILAIHQFIREQPLVATSDIHRSELIKYAQIYDIVEHKNYAPLVDEVSKVLAETREIKNDMQSITKILDESIHGHSHAKNQILKIIAQWMNGEQTGYCFGFEGSPGIGKTSLAKKGLANCLKDINGVSRPFSFIAIGGSCNGSILEGHSYTYVNSTYGKIVEILMDSKCMNPIIYIDELDKVSKTESGKEIIGILTHLIDPTQNTGFQDKYFSGIEIDLSKALFVFSYNDPALIDRILLDRIHRIQFDNLTIEEKVVIVKQYILPEINKKMGIVDSVVLSDDIIIHLIEKYTLESGVRKLKEVIFDLFGEINIELMRCENVDLVLPILVSVEDLEKKYLSKYDKINEKIVHQLPEIGIINGLWANAYGRGGIIPIQTMFFPSTTFLELKLTGMQGDVMKESMNVAKSLAWNILTDQERESLVKVFETGKRQGLHIHCPEGAVQKDGPSAGTAITLAIYSLFTGKPIRHNVAITGETNLQGFVTEIGGLEHKIFGGIRAGIKKFLFPKQNHKDFLKIMKKYGDNELLKGIEFVEVEHISDTFEHIFA